MKQKTIPYSILLVFSIFIYWLWRIDSPYPSVLNWDIFEHQTVINQMSAGRWALFPSHLTDTFRFDGYTTLFHATIAGLQSMLPIDPLGWWWLAEGMHLIESAFLGYALVYMMTKNRWTAFMGGIISATIFESQVAYSNLFLLPQTVSAFFGVVALLLFISDKKFRYILPLILFCLLTHFIIGSYVIGLLIITYFAKNLTQSQTIRFSVALALLIPTVSYMIITSTSVGAINYGEAAAFTHTFTEKLRYLFQWYGSAIVLLPIGICMAIFSTNHRIRTVSVLATVSLATLLAPFPYALKFAVVGRYFLITVLSLPFGWFIQKLTHHSSKIIAITTFTILFTFVFTQNIHHWKETLVRNGTSTEISGDERTATHFLAQSREHTNALLISDPATQYIFEATSGINSQGGAYATPDTRNIASRLIHAPSQKDLSLLVSQLHDTVSATKPSYVLFIASGRYFRWISKQDAVQNIAFNIWRPEGLTLKDLLTIQTFQKNTGLTPIFTNPDCVVFSIPTL